MVKKQVIEFEKDEELSKEAQDKIISLLEGEGATNDIKINFVEEKEEEAAK